MASGKSEEKALPGAWKKEIKVGQVTAADR